MPVIPTVQKTEQISTISFPKRSFTLPKSLGKLGSLFENMQIGADKAEATRIGAETRAQINSIIRLNSAKILDPKEFREKTSEDIQNIQLGLSGQASNRNVQGLVNESLSNDFINAKGAIELGTFLKFKDVALGNFIKAGKSLSDQAAESDDPAVIQKNYNQFAELVGALKGRGLMTNKEMQTEIKKFDTRTSAMHRVLKGEARAEEARQQRNQPRQEYL